MMNKEFFKSGALLGAVSIIITLVLYVIDSTLMVSLWMALFSIILSISLVSYLGIKYRNEHNSGFLSFGTSYVFSLVTMVTSGVIATVFNLLLYTVIDPDLPQVLGDAAYEQGLSMMEFFGASVDSVDDEVLDKMRTDSMERFSVASTLKGLIGVVIGSAIFSLITGAIIKKKEPENDLV
jgi:hypothetical protein